MQSYMHRHKGLLEWKKIKTENVWPQVDFNSSTNKTAKQKKTLKCPWSKKLWKLIWNTFQNKEKFYLFFILEILNWPFCIIQMRKKWGHSYCFTKTFLVKHFMESLLFHSHNTNLNISKTTKKDNPKRKTSFFFISKSLSNKKQLFFYFISNLTS